MTVDLEFDGEEVFQSGNQPPTSYHRPPEYDGIIRQKDETVAMRDGVPISVDIYLSLIHI